MYGNISSCIHSNRTNVTIMGKELKIIRTSYFMNLSDCCVRIRAEALASRNREWTEVTCAGLILWAPSARAASHAGVNSWAAYLLTKFTVIIQPENDYAILNRIKTKPLFFRTGYVVSTLSASAFTPGLWNTLLIGVFR